MNLLHNLEGFHRYTRSKQEEMSLYNCTPRLSVCLRVKLSCRVCSSPVTQHPWGQSAEPPRVEQEARNSWSITLLNSKTGELKISKENPVSHMKRNQRTALPWYYFVLLCWKSSPIKGWGQGGRLKLFLADWQDALLQGLLGYGLRNPGREVNLKLVILFSLKKIKFWVPQSRQVMASALLSKTPPSPF